jgi:MFS transporter, DHA1 family, tetracycline resistance protein
MTPKNKKKTIFAVFFVLFVDNMGLAIVFNFFAPLIMLPSYGMIDASVTLQTKNYLLAFLIAIFPLAQIFAAPVIGDLADSFGRKKAFKLTILGTTFGFLLSAFAILLKSFWLLIIFRFISGMFAGNLSIVMAAIADLNPNEKDRARNYGYFSTILGASWAVALIIGGFFANPKYFNPSLPFFIMALFSMLNFWVMIKFYKETFASNEKVKINILKGLFEIVRALKVKILKLYLFIYLFFFVGVATIYQWAAPYMLEKFQASVAMITWFLVYEGMMWAIGGTLLNKLLIKHLKSKQILILGLGLYLIIMVFASIFQNNFYLYFFLLGSFSLVTSSSFSNLTNCISISAPKSMQGRIMGVTQSILMLGVLTIPIAAGFVASFSINYVIPYCTVVTFIAVFLMFFLPKENSIKKI